MKKFPLSPALLAVALLASACSSIPSSTSLLEQARADYRVAQESSSAARYASLELRQTSEALALVNAAAADHDSTEEIDKLAYFAKQKIALTREVSTQRSAEAEVTYVGKERDQMRLDQRTNEANAAALKAQQSQAAALVPHNEAVNAKRQAQLAQDDAAQDPGSADPCCATRGHAERPGCQEDRARHHHPRRRAVRHRFGASECARRSYRPGSVV